MPNLPENSTFDNVYQLEQGDPVEAGVNGNGVSNRQAQELVNRTRFLRDQLDNLQSQINTINNEITLINTELDGLVIGTDIQAWNATLQDISNLTMLGDRYFATNDVGTPILRTLPINAVVLRDVKSTFAGTGVVNTWNKRDLNTKLGSGNFVTLFGDSTFTINAGEYLIFGSIPATMVDAHMARLRNNANNSYVYSSATQTVTAASISGQSLTTYTHLFCHISLTGATNHQIEHYIRDTIPDRSLGAETGISGDQVYTQIAIVKLN